MKKHQLDGQKFERLTVLSERVDLKTKKHRFYDCLCDCGARIVATQAHLLAGHTRSCGCLLADKNVARSRRHGHAGNSTARRLPSVEYSAWVKLKDRCYNPKNRSYIHYGGRGIRVADEWRDSFEAFFASVGPRPPGKLSLDRINNDGHYEPGNVRWADWSTQRINQRRVTPSQQTPQPGVTIRGRTRPASGRG